MKEIVAEVSGSRAVARHSTSAPAFPSALRSPTTRSWSASATRARFGGRTSVVPRISDLEALARRRRGKVEIETLEETAARSGRSSASCSAVLTVFNGGVPRPMVADICARVRRGRHRPRRRRPCRPRTYLEASRHVPRPSRRARRLWALGPDALPAPWWSRAPGRLHRARQTQLPKDQTGRWISGLSRGGGWASTSPHGGRWKCTAVLTACRWPCALRGVHRMHVGGFMEATFRSGGMATKRKDPVIVLPRPVHGRQQSGRPGIDLGCVSRGCPAPMRSGRPRDVSRTARTMAASWITADVIDRLTSSCTADGVRGRVGRSTAAS